MSSHPQHKLFLLPASFSPSTHPLSPRVHPASPRSAGTLGAGRRSLEIRSCSFGPCMERLGDKLSQGCARSTSLPFLHPCPFQKVPSAWTPSGQRIQCGAFLPVLHRPRPRTPWFPTVRGPCRSFHVPADVQRNNLLRSQRKIRQAVSVLLLWVRSLTQSY